MPDTIAETLGIESNDIDVEAIFNQYITITSFNPELLRKECLVRNAEIVACDKCGVTGNRPNMMRWYFENCKTVMRNCLQCKREIPRQGIKDFLYSKKKYCNRKCYMKSKIGKAPINMTAEVRNKLKGKRNLKQYCDKCNKTYSNLKIHKLRSKKHA